MKPEEFKKFFSNYSENVDNADRQAFWRFSDALILAIIKKHLPQFGPEQIILDAGGGTGRWDIVLAKQYRSKFIVYDLSEDMLRQARKNVVEAGLMDRIQLVQGDLEHMEQIEDDSIDSIVSIYNPISFVGDVERAFRELYRVLKKGGTLLIMGQGYYNALASKVNGYHASSEELSEIARTRTVKWDTYVPPLNVFSKDILESRVAAAGFSVVGTYGIPVFAQPGPEDFDPKNLSRSGISNDLYKEGYFKALFDIEMRYNGMPDVVNRGMNLLSVGKK
jgi:SAM-dependent methyltransferase